MFKHNQLWITFASQNQLLITEANQLLIGKLKNESTFSVSVAYFFSKQLFFTFSDGKSWIFSNKSWNLFKLDNTRSWCDQINNFRVAIINIKKGAEYAVFHLVPKKKVYQIKTMNLISDQCQKDLALALKIWSKLNRAMFTHIHEHCTIQFASNFQS